MDVAEEVDLIAKLDLLRAICVRVSRLAGFLNYFLFLVEGGSHEMASLVLYGLVAPVLL